MPRKASPITNLHFGEHLAALRRAAGLSQRSLARVCGISHRMLAYYEGRAALPPGHVLAELSKVLGVGLDELVGNKVPKTSAKRSASRPLLRRLEQLEKLPLKDKRELLSIIDTYLERNRLLQKAS
jgi:transcriptional regulator with XRE-family HTH domain